MMISIFQRAGEHRKGHPRLPGGITEGKERSPMDKERDCRAPGGGVQQSYEQACVMGKGKAFCVGNSQRCDWKGSLK